MPLRQLLLLKTPVLLAPEHPLLLLLKLSLIKYEIGLVYDKKMGFEAANACRGLRR